MQAWLSAVRGEGRALCAPQLAAAILTELKLPQDEVTHAIDVFRRNHIIELQVPRPSRHGPPHREPLMLTSVPWDTLALCRTRPAHTLASAHSLT